MGPLHYTDQHLESQKDSGAKTKLRACSSPSAPATPPILAAPSTRPGVCTAPPFKFQAIVLHKDCVPGQPCVYIYLENIHLVA